MGDKETEVKCDEIRSQSDCKDTCTWQSGGKGGGKCLEKPKEEQQEQDENMNTEDEDKEQSQEQKQQDDNEKKEEDKEKEVKCDEIRSQSDCKDTCTWQSGGKGGGK